MNQYEGLALIAFLVAQLVYFRWMNATVKHMDQIRKAYGAMFDDEQQEVKVTP